MAGVVLVTGAGRALGERVAARLSAKGSTERIVAVDTVPPRSPLRGRAEFVRADVRSALIGAVLDQAGVDTVLHTAVVDEGLVGLTSLLAACERLRSLTRLVVESSTAVYGRHGGAPSVSSERDDVDDRAEAMVRAFARRRRDVTVTVLRFADLVGPGLDSPMMRQLSRPVITTVAGFDPCVQLLHVDDAVDVAAQACVERHPGAFNVAGDGVLTTAQIARRIGRLRIATVPPLAGARVRATRHRRVVDTTLVAARFGFTPRRTTVEALNAAFGTRRARLPELAAGVVATAERLVRA